MTQLGTFFDLEVVLPILHISILPALAGFIFDLKFCKYSDSSFLWLEYFQHEDLKFISVILLSFFDLVARYTLCVYISYIFYLLTLANYLDTAMAAVCMMFGSFALTSLVILTRFGNKFFNMLLEKLAERLKLKVNKLT
jgi:hypothetical protein